jgi:ERCC4-related helicase
MNYIEFLSNNILNNVTDSQADIIYLKLSRECVSNKIKFEVETEPNELLPYLCLMLLENNLIGPKSANGSKILIDILENQCLSELATKLKIYDQENEFGKLTLKENSNDSGIMSNSSSTNEPLSSLFKNNLQSSKNALEDTISRCSSTLSLFSNESESKISNETDETQEFREVFNVKVLDEMVDLHFKPYDFQVNLALNSCKNVNNLIVVRTGSGKTLVAALITKFWYIKRKKDKTLKTFKCVFLVPTRNLVYQQAASFRRAFSKDFIQEIDEKSNEFKIKEKFQLDEKHVFFMTPQKLVNCLQSCVLNITDISILIFDECHHTNLLHPYNVIMEYYLREKMLNLPLPLIVGLSASLGTGPNDSAFKHIFTLCSNMSCKIISYVKSEGDKQNLNENIPSPLGDIVHHVALSENLKKLLSKTNMVVRELMSLAKIDQQGCEVGSKPFENFLHMLKINSEKSEDQTRINACKYLIELNLFYLGVQDFPIKYSLRKLRNFLAKTNTATFSKYELEFRKHLQSLITYIEKNIERFEINTKLEKMAEVILGHHRNESKGNVIDFEIFITRLILSQINLYI